jgi:ATP-binding cassette subfamily B (MDR/TAP) protein 1
MSLLFGRLTQNFVDFSIVVAKSDAGDASATAQIDSVAAGFRHAASQNASYLVYLGRSLIF